MFFHFEDQLNTISEIQDNLFITSCEGVTQDKLTHLNITYIIDLTNDTYKYEGVTILHLSMRDKLDQELAPLIKETNSFIDEACKKDGKILIHCEQGISRSASIACAWLMHDACKRGESHSFDKMINQIRTKRPIIHPNSGFVTQLLDYEKMLDTQIREPNLAGCSM